MKIFRIVLNGFAAFICVTSIVGLVYLFTLQATVLDRSVVKGWLSDSKIYEGNLIASLIQPANETNAQTDPSAITASSEMMKSALNTTFTPEFIRQQTEHVIDNTYDWTEGKNPKFTFSVPLDQKRTTFIQQLATALAPQVATLPVCGPSSASECRPPNLTVEQLALQMTTQSVDESGFFSAPLTPSSFTQTTQQPSAPILAKLPTLRKLVDILFIVLPVVIVLSIICIIFMTQPERRVAVTAHLSRRVFFSMIFTILPLGVVVFLLSHSNFNLSQMFAAQIGDLVVPLIRTIIVSVAYTLILFSGIVAIIAATAWAGLSMLQKRINASQPPQNPVISSRY